MNDMIDLTKARKSSAIAYCPVCERKGLVSVIRHGEQLHETHYLHKAVVSNGIKLWYEQCIVDELTGEHTEIVSQPHTSQLCVA